MNLTDFLQTLKITFAVFAVLGFLYAFFQARSWGHRNLGPADTFDVKFLGRLLIYVTGCLGLLLFWIIFGVCVYWYFFYKGQSVLYLVLPWATADISILTLALLVTVISEVIFITRELVKQCNIDIFVIDWEKSKGKIMTTNEQTPSPASVSIWRSIFMSNQWSSLQTYRIIHIEFTLLFAIFLLKACQWRYTASSYPNIRAVEPTTVNPILLFAIDSLVLLFVIILQFLFKTLIYNRFFRNKLLQFVDVLSVANISVLIFDELCHGYYIHGRSVHGTADINIDELNHNLRKEENDLVPKRGLQDTTHQAFEIFSNPSFRTTFDKIYSVVASGQLCKQLNLSLRLAKDGKSLIKGASETSIKAYLTINKFLCTLLDRNLKEYPYTIREKGYFEKILGTNPDLSQGLVFFSEETGFKSVLLVGIEWHLLVLYISLFGLLDIAMDDPIKAGIIVYVIDLLMRFLRLSFAKANQSRKTLLDYKFLL